jgi:general secretion pathway protein C
MPKVQTFAWCTLSAMVGFSAGQLAPSLTSDRAPQPRATLPVLAPDPPSTPPAPSTAPTVLRSLPPPNALRPAAAPSAPLPTPAPTTRPNRASLLSAFRFAGIGAHGGIRLGRVTPGSLPDLLGLKTGDEVVTLNGLRIADPQKALQAYAQLPYVDTWTARIHRNGVESELRYALR